MSVPSRGEVFSQMSSLINQMIDCASTMAHLHRTEAGDKDKKLALGWLMMAEMFKGIRQKIILLGQGRLN